jgi:hypothetical protein
LRKAASVALLKLVRVPAFEAQVLMCRYVCWCKSRRSDCHTDVSR